MRRQLDLNELEKISEKYFKGVEYSETNEVKDKLTQLMNFLYTQDISKNILERIRNDHLELYNEVQPLNDNSPEEHKKAIIEKLLMPADQGAFGYFLIDKKYREPRKYEGHYIDLPWYWYDVGYTQYEKRESFNNYFLNPFKELFDWYLYESQPKNNSDYFSKESQEKIFEKLDEIQQMLTKQGFGQEIIFNEIDDLKRLTNKLSQKNWREIIKGKFLDLIIENLITIESAKAAFKILTGVELDLLS